MGKEFAGRMNSAFFAVTLSAKSILGNFPSPAHPARRDFFYGCPCFASAISTSARQFALDGQAYPWDASRPLSAMSGNPHPCTDEESNDSLNARLTPPSRFETLSA
jgi:hypothetical protein